MLQIEALRQQQPHLLVATPGRLLDLIDDEECPLSLGAPLLTFMTSSKPSDPAVSSYILLSFGPFLVLADDETYFAFTVSDTH